jgi:CRP-like cAMP-binding protein
MSPAPRQRRSDGSSPSLSPAAVEAIHRTWPTAAPDTTHALIRSATVVRANGTTLMSEGERPSRAGLVVRGTVIANWSSPDGRTVFAGIYGPGQFMGLATLSGGPMTVGIEAMAAVTILTWDSQQFHRIAAADPAMMLDLLDRATYAVQALNHSIKLRTFTSAKSRLAGQLLRYERLSFSSERPLIARGQLSALAGVTPQMVSRIVREWEAAGIVRRVGAYGLELLERDALVAEAAPLDEFPAPGSAQRGSWAEPGDLADLVPDAQKRPKEPPVRS